MRGELEQVEHLVAAVWDGDISDARRAHLSSGSPTPGSSETATSTGALAAHESTRRLLTDPDALAAVDARRANLLAGAGRPAEALRITDAMGPVTLGTHPGRAGRRPGHQPPCRRALRGGQARWPAGPRPTTPSCPTGWPGGASPSTSSTRPTPSPTPAATTKPRSCWSRRPSGPWPRQRSGAWTWFEMSLAEIARDTGRAPRGDPALRRRGRGGTDDRAGRRARVGPRRRRPGPPAARPLRRGGRGARAGRRDGRQPDRHVVRDPGADACVAGRLPRRPAVGPRPHPGDHRSDPAATRWPSSKLALLHDLVRLGVPEEAVDRLEELASRIDGPLAAIHAANARALVDRDTALQHDVVDRYEAIDALALAAEAAAELADLHRAAGEARLATAAAQRAADARGSRRRAPHPGAGAGCGRRAAHRPRAGGRPAGRRGAQQPGDRRAPRSVDPHGRHPPGPRVPEARDRRPRRSRRRPRHVARSGRT